jgi:hypothetical protein
MPYVFYVAKGLHSTFINNDQQNKGEQLNTRLWDVPAPVGPGHEESVFQTPLMVRSEETVLFLACPSTILCNHSS